MGAIASFFKSKNKPKETSPVGDPSAAPTNLGANQAHLRNPLRGTCDWEIPAQFHQNQPLAESSHILANVYLVQYNRQGSGEDASSPTQNQEMLAPWSVLVDLTHSSEDHKYLRGVEFRLYQEDLFTGTRQISDGFATATKTLNASGRPTTNRAFAQELLRLWGIKLPSSTYESDFSVDYIQPAEQVNSQTQVDEQTSYDGAGEAKPSD